MAKLFNFDETGISNDIFKYLIQNNKEIEKNKINLKFSEGKITSGEKEEKLDQLDNDFDFFTDKLNLIIESNLLNSTKNVDFFEMAVILDNNNISNLEKISSLLTYGCLLSLVPSYIEKSTPYEMDLIIKSFTGVPLNQYKSYGMIMLNPTVIREIMDKTESMDKRLEIIYSIYEYCDEVIYDDISMKEYRDVLISVLKHVKSIEMENNFNHDRKNI